MIVSFRDAETEAIFDNDISKRARRRLPVDLWNIAQRKLDQIKRVDDLEQL